MTSAGVRAVLAAALLVAAADALAQPDSLRRPPIVGTDEIKGARPAPAHVSGRITMASGEPAPGLLVRAWHKDLRRDTELGSARTDAAGRYRADLDRDRVSGPVNLVLRVYSSTGAVIGESQVRFRAKPEETIDVVISNAAPKKYDFRQKLDRPAAGERLAPR